MNPNLQDLQFWSKTASLKIALEGQTFISVPTTSTEVSTTATIPHGAGTDDLIWQVGGVLVDTVDPTVINQNVITPFSTFDGRTQVWALVDSVNLYVTLQNSTVGSPIDATQFTFSYRILVP